jgi:hypothetical protein
LLERAAQAFPRALRPAVDSSRVSRRARCQCGSREHSSGEQQRDKRVTSPVLRARATRRARRVLYRWRGRQRVRYAAEARVGAPRAVSARATLSALPSAARWLTRAVAGRVPRGRRRETGRCTAQSVRLQQRLFSFEDARIRACTLAHASPGGQLPCTRSSLLRSLPRGRVTLVAWQSCGAHR